MLISYVNIHIILIIIELNISGEEVIMNSGGLNSVRYLYRMEGW